MVKGRKVLVQLKLIQLSKITTTPKFLKHLKLEKRNMVTESISTKILQ